MTTEPNNPAARASDEFTRLDVYAERSAMTLHSKIAHAIRGATDDGANTTTEYADAVLPVAAQRIREIARTGFQPTFGVFYSGLDVQERLFRAADRIERGEA